MLERVPNGENLSGLETEPDVSVVRTHVHRCKLVVNVVAKDRQNRLRCRVLLQPDFEMSVCVAPRDEASTKHVCGCERSDGRFSILLHN